MLQIRSYGAAKMQPSGTVSGRPPFNLIIYVKYHAHLSLTGAILVCSDLEQVTTSGDSPTALYGGAE